LLRVLRFSPASARVSALASPPVRPARPSPAGKINSALLLGCALAEGTAIFGFITALLVIFMG